MDMSSTEPVTQPAPNAPKGRKPRPPKAPKDPNAPAPKAPKPRPPKTPIDPNAPPPEPKAPKAPKVRKPRPPKAPKAPKEPKVDITHSGPIHYHETDDPVQAPFVAVYSETIEEDVPTKQRKPRSSGLDLSMENLRL